MNAFSVKSPRSLVPSRGALCAVVMLSIGISFLYLVVSLFIMLTLAGILSLDCVPVSLVISVVELSLTVLSIVVAIIATYIDGDVQRRCANYLKKVYDDNPWLQDDEKIKCAVDQIERRGRRSKTIQGLVLFACLVHLVMLIYFKVVSGSTVFQSLSIGIDCVSTFVSVILAFVSSLSCFAFGDDVQVILGLMVEGLNAAFDRVNSARISASHLVGKE